MKLIYPPRFTLVAMPKLSMKRILTTLLLVLSFGIMSAQNSANIVVTPATVNVEVGQTFAAKVRVNMLSGEINGAEIHLAFNNTYLNVTAVSISAGMPLGLTALPLEPLGTINTNGRINFAAGTATTPYPSASFDMLDITFTVLAAPPGGTTPLTFLTTPPATAIEREGVDALNALVNGLVGISPAACTGTPTASISSSGNCISSPFQIQLASSPAPTGTGPWDLTINGTTYNNINAGASITSVTPAAYSLFEGVSSASNAPATEPVTLGMRFNVMQSGYITAIRFFAPATVTGTYTGQIWQEFIFGAPVASVTFSGVTPNAWNQANLSTPLLLTAGTTYIASYHMTDPTGLFAYVPGGMASENQDGPLESFASATGGNGVFNAGGVPGYPGNNSAPSHNYLADVVFRPNVYTYNLTQVKDAGECINVGALQTLTVTLVPGTCSTLPVGLTNLSATPDDRKITIRWSTSSEQNNKGFEVQRSLTANGNDWQVIGFVAGAGNSSTTKNYSYVDNDLAPKRYYYRLNQLDFDNRSKMSSTVSADINGKTVFALEQNFPNPFRDQSTTIRFTLPQRSSVNLSVYDMHGRLIKVLVSGSKDAGTHAIPFESGTLGAGVYYYRIQAGEFNDVKKMTIQ